MKILTIGASPYLLTKLGRLNSDIILFLEGKGHQLATATWHFDSSWYPTDDDGGYYYEYNKKPVCRIFPFINMAEQAMPVLYDIIKDSEPDLVITIGDIQEIDYVHLIKNVIDKKFKWISIATLDALPLNENRIESVKEMDKIITISKFAQKELSKYNKETYYIGYGPNDNFKPLGITNKEFLAMSMAKNSSANNIGSLIYGLKNFDDKIYLHSNINDPGEYNINLLIDRYNLKDKIILPNKFISINDGYTDEELNYKYNNSMLYVDIPVRSASGLTVLEAMRGGCIPIVTKIGILEEIIEDFDINIEYKNNMYVDSVDYVGFDEEIYKIPDPKDLVKKIHFWKQFKKNNEGEYNLILNILEGYAKNYSNNKFLNRFYDEINDINNNSIKVEII